MPLGERFDAYTLKARFYPSLLLLLPVFLAFLAWVPEAEKALGGIISLAVTCGGAYLLTELGRDRGRKREPALYELWGGKPTTVALRHSGTSNPVLLERRHKQIHAVTGLEMPTAEEERADPGKADQTYDAAVSVLREKTRDRARSRLIFEENRSYGFRRNLWGLKPWGIACALAALLAAGARAYYELGPLTFACAGACVVALALWLLRVTPGWVRLTGEAYAQALIASLETLETDQHMAKK